MAMPAIQHEEWTADMLDDVPDDGRRWEVIDGQLLVTPAPIDEHQLVLGELYALFHAYIQRTKIAKVLFSPSDVRRGTKTRMQPDLFVIALADGRRPAYPYTLSDLLLTIEIVSPGSRRADHHVRRRAYLDAGVPVYWIVDSDARHIERWTTGDERPELVTDQIEWRAPGFDHPLAVSIPELFLNALGEP